MKEVTSTLSPLNISILILGYIGTSSVGVVLELSLVLAVTLANIEFGEVTVIYVK